MKSPFFKAVCIYRLSREVRIVREALHNQLSQFTFVPCTAQDMAQSGWVDITPEMLALEHDGSYLLSYQDFRL